jgi:hypothetical protein
MKVIGSSEHSSFYDMATNTEVKSFVVKVPEGMTTEN